MSIDFELAGSQIDGARDYQEDAFLITHLTDSDDQPSALVIVADGMGGHAAGNVASNMAVQALNKYISSNYPTDDLTEVMTAAVNKANDSIRETVAETEALQGMGCTMVAVLLEKDKVHWVSVGDSHLYLIRNNEVIKKNEDHSYGGFLDRMEAAGTPIQVDPSVARNMLMSAVTGEEIEEIDVSMEPFSPQAGDRLLICSDGMDSINYDTIMQCSSQTKTPKEFADALMLSVQEANIPRQDNTTAVTVNVVSKQPNLREKEVDISRDIEEVVIGDEAPSPRAQAQQRVQINIPDDEDDKPKSKMGMIIGIIVVLLALAGGGYFMLGQSPKSTSDVTSSDVASVEDSTDDFDFGDEDSTEDTTKDSIADTKATTTPITKEQTSKQQPTDAKEQPATKVEPKTEVPKKPSQNVFQDKLKSGGKGPKMVVIPAGTLKMGSNSTRYTNENPKHDVKMKSFAVSQHEITITEYELFATQEQRKIPDNRFLDKKIHPVFYVTWDDAFYYAKWLSKQTGHKYRLPSEAEWEYMASGGVFKNYWWGSRQEKNVAHCFGCGSVFNPREPAPIGSFKPNKFNVYDTAGNMGEWVQDCWHPNYAKAPDDGSVWEGGDCTLRVVRSGTFSSPPQSLRTSRRDKFKPDEKYDHIGIRLVRDLP